MVTLLCDMKQQKEEKLGNIAKPQHNKTQIMLTEFCPVLPWRANTLDLLLQDELAELEVVPRLKVQRIHRPNRPGQCVEYVFTVVVVVWCEIVHVRQCPGQIPFSLCSILIGEPMSTRNVYSEFG